MIIGNGLIAKAFAPQFAHDDQVAVFASGVSFSGEARDDQFDRERSLLREVLATRRYVVYFSTCSVKDPELAETPYVVHKRAMEELVRQCERYAIFRLPQVVGVTLNPTTLTNYIFGKVSSGERFKIWLHARRNIIDVDDVASIGTSLLRSREADNATTNIVCPFSISVLDLVKTFEEVLDTKADYECVTAGGSYEIDATRAADVARSLGIAFDDDYIRRVIRKYYGRRASS